jgi:hypothetical protein
MSSPKLLLGSIICESDKISSEDKIVSLIEIVDLNEKQLDQWIKQEVASSSPVGKYLNTVFTEGAATEVGKEAAKKVVKKAGPITKALGKVAKKTGEYLTKTSDKELASGASKKVWEKPIRTVAKTAVVGGVAIGGYNYLKKKIDKRYDGCTAGCKEIYKKTKDKEKFSKCAEACLSARYASLKKAKAAGK